MPQRLRGRRHDPRVEGGAHRQELCVDAGLGGQLDRPAHGVRRPRDDGLQRTVLVGGDRVAVDPRQDLFCLLGPTGERRHEPVILDPNVRHLASAGAHGGERVGERQDLRRDQGGVLAQAVAGDHVWPDPVVIQQPEDGDVRGQHRGLRDLGLLESVIRARQSVRVGRVDEHKVRERRSDQRLQGRVGLPERVADDVRPAGEVGAHVHVLRSLAREEERHPAVGTWTLAVRGTLDLQAEGGTTSVVPYGVRDLAQAGAKVGDGGDPEGDAVWERVRPGGPDAASGVFEVPVLGRDLNGSSRGRREVRRARAPQRHELAANLRL